jgi:hypothetical protein
MDPVPYPLLLRKFGSFGNRNRTSRSAYNMVGQQILAGGSTLRGGQTQVGEPKFGEHVQ